MISDMASKLADFQIGLLKRHTAYPGDGFTATTPLMIGARKIPF